jgi:hypothetical protein
MVLDEKKERELMWSTTTLNLKKRISIDQKQSSASGMTGDLATDAQLDLLWLHTTIK